MQANEAEILKGEVPVLRFYAAKASQSHGELEPHRLLAFLLGGPISPTEVAQVEEAFFFYPSSKFDELAAEIGMTRAELQEPFIRTFGQKVPG